MLSNLPIRRCSAPADVLADLRRFGAALIDEVLGPSELVGLARSLGVVAPHRDSGPDGVTSIEDRGVGSPGMAGFTRAELLPHTDRSGVDEPPILLLTACGRRPCSGGESLLVDGQVVHDDLARNAPDALVALSAPRSALFGGADGHLGSVFTRGAEGVVAIRLRLDSLVRFAPAAVPHLPVLRAAIRRHMIVLPVRAGSGYVLNNHRWLHGRRGFEGPRLMYRVIADPLPGAVPGGFEPEAPLPIMERALDRACEPLS